MNHKTWLTRDILQKVLFADIFYLKNIPSDEKDKLLEKWYKDFVFSTIDIQESAKTDIVFFRSLVRDDYKKQLHSVTDELSSHNFLIIEDFKSRGTNINLQASRFLQDNQWIIKRLDFLNTTDKALCFIRICYYLYVLEKISSIKFNRFVCFADMQPVEHLATHFFRHIRKLKTATFQHGLYVDYGSLDTVNVINYLHSPSEYFLAWGDCTKELIDKYHKTSKIYVCGKPYIHIPEKSSSNTKKYIMVFTDQRIFDEQNFAMLEIATEFAARNKLDCKVRFHPSNNKRMYFDKFPDIIEDSYFVDAEFVVGHTSSLIYESMTLGCKTFRYVTDVPAIDLPDELNFSTPDSLKSAVNNYVNRDYGNYFINCTGKRSIEKYSAFFKEFLAE